MEKSLSPELDLWRRDIEESIAVKQRVLADDTLLRRTMQVAQLMAEAATRGNRVLFAGNGGSAADAQHL
ncbi:MAG TPA: phosphoheptose isomerase, partial [Burkholderiaceae bacterium]|nr:phosphoheptose isomerase [Burkholderiaceae bacterium]